MSKKGCCDDCQCSCPLGYTAEGTIKTLEAENAELESENDAWQTLSMKYLEKIKKLERVAKAAKEEHQQDPEYGYCFDICPACDNLDKALAELEKGETV